MYSFTKYGNSPVFGNDETGTFFDAYVWRDNGRYRMDFSYRREKACAVSFSDDGIHWETPVITLPANPESGWEEHVNRNCVIKVGDVYKMWYTGQARGHSFIGYAESADGIRFSRLPMPVMIPEYPFENASVMNPCVLYEDGLYKMWYSAGETYEPNANAYATSRDGLAWEKCRINPIFTCVPENEYEQNRIGGCQVIHTEDMGYLMFYIGYKDIDTACICVARSENGVTGWERSPINPLILPEKGRWDGDACYKPTAVWNEEENKWMLWYNGRTEDREYIGLAEYEGRDLFSDIGEKE